MTRSAQLAPGSSDIQPTDVEAGLAESAAELLLHRLDLDRPCGLAGFRVQGVDGLRVVDAAAMPDLVSGNINACVLMMAEKASDMIRGRAPLVAADVP